MKRHLSWAHPLLQGLENESVPSRSNLQEALLGEVEYLLNHKPRVKT